MEFIHQPYEPHETIAAIATPPGEGGVAIIRISGKEAFQKTQLIFSGPIQQYSSHTVHFGKLRTLQGEHVDDVLLLLMKGPRSFTGEDTIEIHCHGGSLITRKVLETVLQTGIRAARPGEFSFKAFMNGKMDLAQAEAIQELICAKNEKALSAAESQLQGSLSRKILHFQQAFTHIAAILEAWVDFPEEGLEFAAMEDVCEQIGKICQQMQTLVNTFENGRIIHDGVSLCLIGSPNVGKSSLMNALLDKDRAIVSPIPGTTRDILEDHLRLNGLNVRLSDTAGIRNTQEMIEQEGIRRTKEIMKEADLVLMVLDATREIDTEEQILIQELPKSKTLFVWNKIDLKKPTHLLNVPHQAHISAKCLTGLEKLKEKIDQVIWQKGVPSKEEIVITNVRHKESLQKAISYATSVTQGLRDEVSPEFLAMDMRQTLMELGKIIGTNITEDILSAIFSKFCIGK